MDIEALVAPVSEQQPAGEDLEYDLEFGELVRCAQGTPEKRTGDHVIEAVPPDWKSVRDQALGLCERTRDLRIAVHITNALMRLEGFQGLLDGLELCRRLSEELWDSVHPQLDEDDGDATMRCNAVRELVNREVALNGLLDIPFVSSKVAGRFALRDLKIIAGELQRPDDDDRPVPQKQLVEAAFRESDPQEIESTLELVNACIEAATALQGVYTSQVGSVEGPDLEEFISLLAEVAEFVSRQMANFGIGEVTVEADAQTDGAQEGGGGSPVTGDVRTREDVLRMIEKICLYYQQQEPSSPVPLLLQRAASLVNKGFMEIVADLTPAGVSEAERYAVTNSSESADGWGDSGSGDGVEKTDDSW